MRPPLDSRPTNATTCFFRERRLSRPRRRFVAHCRPRRLIRIRRNLATLPSTKSGGPFIDVLSPTCRPDDPDSPDLTGSQLPLSCLISKTPSRRNDRASRCGALVFDHRPGRFDSRRLHSSHDLAERVGPRTRLERSGPPVLAAPAIASPPAKLTGAASWALRALRSRWRARARRPRR